MTDARGGPGTMTLRSGAIVQGRAVTIVDELRQAGFRVYLRDRGLRFTVEPASRIPRDIYDQIDGSIELRDDILAVLRDLDECPPAA